MLVYGVQNKICVPFAEEGRVGRGPHSPGQAPVLTLKHCSCFSVFGMSLPQNHH